MKIKKNDDDDGGAMGAINSLERTHVSAMRRKVVPDSFCHTSTIP